MGSKARESAKAKSLVFVLFDFRCQKKSVMYEMECRFVAVQRGKQELKHIQTTFYLICSEMGSQCSFSRRSVEWW